MFCRLILLQLRSLFLSTCRLLLRVLCVFKRKRKPSGDIIIEDIVVEKDRSKSSSKDGSESFVPWNAWEDRRELTTEDYIQKYRQSLVKARVAEKESETVQEDLNLFQDMEPEIRVKPTSLKNLLPVRNSNQQKVSFTVQEDYPLSLQEPTELGDLIDDEFTDSAVGWEMDDNIDVVLKQHKIEERRKRAEEQLKRKEQRHGHAKAHDN